MAFCLIAFFLNYFEIERAVGLSLLNIYNKFRWCNETNQLLRNTIIKQRSLPIPVSRHQASNRVGRHNTNAPANAPGYCQSRALLIDDAIEQTSTDHALA